MSSNFLGVEPEDKVRRWDKKTDVYVIVKCLALLRKHNSSMASVENGRLESRFQSSSMQYLVRISITSRRTKKVQDGFITVCIGEGLAIFGYPFNISKRDRLSSADISGNSRIPSPESSTRNSLTCHNFLVPTPMEEAMRYLQKKSLGSFGISICTTNSGLKGLTSKGSPNRKMGFVVDKVSEDSFYENLLLGLSKVLEKSPCVSKMSLKRLSGVRQVDIRAWEHNNGVILPEDLRSFYSSTNGFLFTYEFSYDYHTNDEEERDSRLGVIQINPINDLIRTFGYETKNTAQVECVGKMYSLTLSRDSKVFDLAIVEENAKVVLVYPTNYSVPTIWFYSGQMHFSYLAEDFTTYFRMCIAHLGIPCWQYVFSKEGLPEWSKEMFNIIAPGVLTEDRNLIDSHSYKYSIEHINKIDPNVFTITQSCTTLPMERIQNNIRQPDNKNKEKNKAKILPKRAMSCKSKRGY